jgi:serine/threonine-protein kinase
MIGKSLTHFRVTEKLGEGGMGEVYRAEDSKLGREVALKVLPAAFAEDAERMARFGREAQVLASLNHPNIAGIFQVEHDGDTHFLVMELVEGETLSERLERGPVPLQEALQMTLQVIEALEEAHDRGIIHRDLKPANIKVTPKGQIKVLDFGLAKALEGSPAGSGSGTRPAVTHSPTLTVQMSGAGMLLGTAAYMSPEQARGETADRRADIWALGIVMMEMLTGKTVYGSKTVSDTLAGVLAREPQWQELPKDTPRPIRRLLQRCLEKESRERMQAIGEARIAIERFLADPAPAEEDVDSEIQAPASQGRRIALCLAGAALLAAIVALVALLIGGHEVDVSPTRSSLALPEGRILMRGYGSPVAISPDGRRVAQIFAGGTEYDLFLRSLDQWDGASLVRKSGQERPYQPFFSPDGEWLGFVTPNALKKVPISGGTPIKLCDVNLSRGATWGEDGTIVFAPNPTSGLFSVPDAGGEPTPLTELDPQKDEASHRWPQFLPGGRGLLFTVHSAASNFDEAWIEALDLTSGERRVVHRGGSNARYVSSGHLIYMNQGTLFSLPFDAQLLEATGSAAPVVQQVGSSGEGGAYFDVSGTGTLVFLSGEAGGGLKLKAVLADREGRVEPLITEERDFRQPRFSPDGDRLAVEIASDEGVDIWVYDLERDVPTRLTFDDGYDGRPVWSPDGEFIAFASGRTGGGTGIFRKASDGSGEVEELARTDRAMIPYSWSSDGRSLAVMVQNPDTNFDLAILSLETGEIEPFLTSPYVEYSPVFSPDGRWMAYGNNESGDWEVYVRPVGGGKGKWQISSGGGVYPVWSRDGKEIFIGGEGGSVQVVSVETEGGEFRVERPTPLFSGAFADLTGGDSMYDVAPDGQGLVLFQGEISTATSGHEHLRLIANWFSELEETFSR